MPALPLGDAGTYVAAAYLVFLALIFIYVIVIGARAARLERELETLGELMDKRPAEERAAEEATA
jgi:CcmD family protein